MHSAPSAGRSAGGAVAASRAKVSNAVRSTNAQPSVTYGVPAQQSEPVVAKPPQQPVVAGGINQLGQGEHCCGEESSQAKLHRTAGPGTGAAASKEGSSLLGALSALREKAC